MIQLDAQNIHRAYAAAQTAIAIRRLPQWEQKRRTMGRDINVDAAADTD